MFMKVDYVDRSDIAKSDPFNEDQYLRAEIIDLGDHANEFINLVDTDDFKNEDKNAVRFYCLQYLRVLCSEIKRRFNNIRNNFYDFVHCLNPVNTVSPNFRNNNPSIMRNLINHFRGLIENEDEGDLILNQWNSLIRFNLPNDVRDRDIKIDTFWFLLYYLRNDAGEYPFRDLAKFALNVPNLCNINIF